MAWRLLTVEDVLSALNAAEMAAYRAVLANADKSAGDVLPKVIATVVAEARSHIADCPTNRLAAGDTVPDRIVHHLVAIVRYRLGARLGVRMNDERTQEYKDARRYLERISECRVAIEWPEGVIEEDGNNQNVELVSRSDRMATRENLKGM